MMMLSLFPFLTKGRKKELFLGRYSKRERERRENKERERRENKERERRENKEREIYMEAKMEPFFFQKIAHLFPFIHFLLSFSLSQYLSKRSSFLLPFVGKGKKESNQGRN